MIGFTQIKMNINYLEQIKKEITYITPYEDDAPWEFFNQGMDFFKSNRLEEAEVKFKELIISQPKHHDGYYGLALIYKKLTRKNESLFFIMEAIVMAEKFLEDGSLDQEVMDELQEELQEIRNIEV